MTFAQECENMGMTDGLRKNDHLSQSELPLSRLENQTFHGQRGSAASRLPLVP
jgi:hypothetical protein